MSEHYGTIAFTPSVREVQSARGGRRAYARGDARAAATPANDPLTATERAFLAERDGFYLSTVSETGWPYDYAHRRRLKLFGHARLVDVDEDGELVTRLAHPDDDAVLERAVLVTVAAFDWNCPQHITPRFTIAALRAAQAPTQRPTRSPA